MKRMGIAFAIIAVLWIFTSAPVYYCILPATIGALLFIIGSRQETSAVLERRHQEIVDATQEKKG